MRHVTRRHVWRASQSIHWIRLMTGLIGKHFGQLSPTVPKIDRGKTLITAHACFLLCIAWLELPWYRAVTCSTFHSQRYNSKRLSVCAVDHSIISYEYWYDQLHYCVLHRRSNRLWSTDLHDTTLCDWLNNDRGAQVPSYMRMAQLCMYNRP